jgi:hypothetical protein
MGNCMSNGDREGKQVSDQIDRQLEEDHKKFKRECKILLLGDYFTLSCRRKHNTVVELSRLAHTTFRRLPNPVPASFHGHVTAYDMT